MKKLGKLTINPEKVITNEELVNLRGGDYGTTACCWCYDGNTILGSVVGTTYGQCAQDCMVAYPDSTRAVWIDSCG